MYGYFPDDAAGYFPTPRRQRAELTPEQRSQLLGDVAARSSQAAELLFKAIDTPASYLRDAVVGAPLGSGTNPGQMLDSLGLRPSPEALGGFGRPAAEFLAGALVDPLNFVGVGGVAKAGAAARAVSLAPDLNLLDDATRVMSRRLLNSGQVDNAYARNALESWSQNFGRTRDNLSDADLLARPLAGRRQAQRSLTLRDVVEDASQYDPATGKFSAARSAADQKPLIESIENQGYNFSEIADQPLRQDLGIGLPFSDTNVVGLNLPGGAYMAEGLDRLGQAVRWSSPVRALYAGFDRDTFGAIDEAGQIVGKEVASAIRKANADSGRIISETLLGLENDVLKRRDLAQSMRRLLDGFGEQADLDLITPGSSTYRRDLHDFFNSWHKPGGLKDEYLARRKAAGLASRAYQDRFGGAYFPSHVDDLSFLSKIEAQATSRASKAGGAGRRGRAFSTMSGDQIGRKISMQVPGGRDMINRLSLDANIAGPSRSLKTDQAAGQYIKGIVDAEIQRLFPKGPKPKYSLRSAERLARVLHQLDSDSIKRGLPMFGSHFADSFGRYVTSNERGMAVADVLYDFLARGAQSVPARQRVDAAGEGLAIPLRNAAKRLGLRTVKTTTPAGVIEEGAVAQLKQRLAARFPGALELKNFSVDSRMVERLSRIADFYDYPEVQNAFLKYFDGITRVWKGSILAWPARFTRDWYSGAFSNAVEVGVGPTLWRGYTAARYLIQGQWDQLDGLLADMPRYRRVQGLSARRQKFQTDLAASGLLGGRRAADTAEAAEAIQAGTDVANEFLPGMNPRTTLGYQAWDALTGSTPLGMEAAAYSEFGKNWNRFMDMGLRRPRDLGNPIMRWSQQLGDTTDSINRASGYMALLMKGVDPMEAARRMKMAHVDYSTLTTFERGTMRRFIPFWAYLSRIGKWVASKIAERPGGRYTQFGLRAPQAILGSDDEYVPESIRSNYGAPVSPEIASLGSFLTTGTAASRAGVTPWLTDIDLPGIDQINMFRPGYGPDGDLSITGTLWNTFRDAAGRQLHVIPRNILEAVIGENLYTGRPSKEFRPLLSELAVRSGLSTPQGPVAQTAKAVAPWLDLVPFVPRTGQILNRLIDSEKVPNPLDRAYQLGVNAISGVKFQPVTDEASTIDAMKNLGEMMEQDPLVRTFRAPYIPKDLRPYADQNLLDFMTLQQELSNDLAENRARRLGLPVTRKRQPANPYSYFQ